MPSFRKPNMSKVNSAVRKLKSANNRFQAESRKSMNALKRLDRESKSYSRKLRASSSLPLSSVPSLYLESNEPDEIDFYHEDTDTKIYDVFISHASEDKNDVARPLAHALEEFGLNVWYDEFELRIGDSLRRKIDRGINNSSFGIIIISQSFIKKGWTNYELDGLITRSVNGEQIMLPVWHNISKREVMDYSSSLADKVARSTSEFTVEEIADEIADVIFDARAHE